MLSLGTTTTIFGEISTCVKLRDKQMSVQNFHKKNSAWPPMPMLRKGNTKKWYI